MVELNRREFVVGASVACAGLCLACSQVEAQSRPSSGPVPKGTLPVGNVKDYAKGSISDKYRSNGVFISHQDDQIFALSTKCTHKNVLLDVKADKSGLHCKAHGSDFTEQGTVDNGPAKRSLSRYAIMKSNSGDLTVNFDKTFSEPEWEKPESFVKVSQT